ncbi:thiamine phosphate synthase [Dokdonia sp. Dokd-P16]|uniref:thiamine phosphate synthase n=1 Tax=Dokdonia sp. Dokd-P16 TaxID=2173169 RepID=UPI000D5433EA|nr:thiamine phosphate synthase [Dokdonia sp. Dokd-P16]AWH74010.1 thiamine phosphate synthase [Dokdonia sp. Dokd-P16]
MIILISSEKTSESEIETLHQLFEAGLSHFHLRKPDASLDEHIAYLNMVDSAYHNRIMTHNFHKELCNQFNIMGVHLEEAMWRAQGDRLEDYVISFTSKGNIVSSSYHEPQDLASQAVRFAYTLLSPVFSAISKSDMQGRGFDVRHINKDIVGMGGINATTTPEALKLGFKGVGALGGIWNADDPVVAFVEMKTAFAKANT